MTITFFIIIHIPGYGGSCLSGYSRSCSPPSCTRGDSYREGEHIPQRTTRHRTSSGIQLLKIDQILTYLIRWKVIYLIKIFRKIIGIWTHDLCHVTLVLLNIQTQRIHCRENMFYVTVSLQHLNSESFTRWLVGAWGNKINVLTSHWFWVQKNWIKMLRSSILTIHQCAKVFKLCSDTSMSKMDGSKMPKTITKTTPCEPPIIETFFNMKCQT